MSIPRCQSDSARYDAELRAVQPEIAQRVRVEQLELATLAQLEPRTRDGYGEVLPCHPQQRAASPGLHVRVAHCIAPSARGEEGELAHARQAVGRNLSARSNWRSRMTSRSMSRRMRLETSMHWHSDRLRSGSRVACMAVPRGFGVGVVNCCACSSQRPACASRMRCPIVRMSPTTCLATNRASWIAARSSGRRTCVVAHLCVTRRARPQSGIDHRRAPMAAQDLAAALERVQSVLRRRPETGLHDDAPATARWDNGLRVVSHHANGTQVPTDMPSEFGGTGDHVTPGWLLRAGRRFVHCHDHRDGRCHRGDRAADARGARPPAARTRAACWAWRIPMASL